MFKFFGECADTYEAPNGTLLDDAVVSLISRIGINFPMSDQNQISNTNVPQTIFEITQKTRWTETE
ncbi:hypothetical protein L0128_22005 [candidate division KSB1 bacterium]|nr:hypothetical protein [candidate division KSB1 bacterium]